MTQLFTNNATGNLSAGITAAATSLTLSTGQGARFPAPTGGDFFLLTLFQMSGATEVNHEIVKCTSRTSDTLVIVRGQEGSTARAFSTADPVSLRITAGTLAPVPLGAVPVTDKDATGGYAGLTLFKINFKNALNTFTSFFTNANTAARTYLFQDRDGTIADNTDLALKADKAGPTFTGNLTAAVIITSGSIGIGAAAGAGRNLEIAKTITGATTGFMLQATGIVQSDVTTEAIGFNTAMGTVAATYTLPFLTHYNATQASFGAGSTVTAQAGFYAGASLVGAGSNYGFYGGIPSGAGRWNLYMGGTAINYMNGNLLLGSTTDGGSKLQVTGATTLTGNLTVTGTVTGVTKTHVGLANVDNTADTAKPVSTAQQTALNLKVNTSDKDASSGFVGLSTFSINFRNAANTFTSFFTNANTASRTYTFPNRTGTIADNTDLAAKADLVNPSFTGVLALNGGIQEANTSANSGTAITITTQSLQYIALTGSATFTFPAVGAGKQFTLVITQDATGSRSISWPTAVRWPGGTAPTPTATASKTDVYSFLCDGTYWLGFVGGQNYTRA